MVKYRVETKNGAFLGIIEGKGAFRKFREDFHKYNKYVKDGDMVLVEVRESKKTEYTIYDDHDVTSDENMKEARENLVEDMFRDSGEDGTITIMDNYGEEVKLTREEYRKSLTDEKIYEECHFMNETWFNDAKAELKHVSEGEVLAIADLDGWNGRCPGYMELESLEEVIYSSCDYERLYVDSNGDLRKDESHHDGSNSILYRYWKEGLTERQKENFLNKICHGECTQKDITRYTRKAGVGIADVFGWTVRGGENKYRNLA